MGSASDTRVWVGVLAKARGLRGELVARPASPGSDLLLHVARVLVEGESSERDVVRARAERTGIVLELSGVADRTAAEQLAGRRLGVERSAFPPAQEDELYLDELVGLAAVAPDGRPLGRVAGLESAGTQDWLVVEHAGGRSLVPFVDALVKVEKAAGRVIVDAPEGLLDLEKA